MSTLNTVIDMINSIKTTEGLITLWRPDNSQPDWRTANSQDPNGLIATNKFAHFIVPYPLKWRNDNGKGTFWINRKWRGLWRKQQFNSGDVANMYVSHDGNRPVRNGGAGYTTEFWHLDDVGDISVPLITDPNIWLPYVIIPADGLPGSYDRRVYFQPLSDGLSV